MKQQYFAYTNESGKVTRMNAEERFFEVYKRYPEGESFCPYRICPIGAHSDHQYGKITGLALDKGIRIVYSIKKNGVIEMNSLQFDKRAQFHVRSVPEEKCEDWADYLRGATIALGRKYDLDYGICGVIEGSLPIGGLSSSASVVIAFLQALCAVNRIHLTAQELIQFSLLAENEYVGVQCGKLDQSCEIYAKKDHLLYLDTLDDSYELIPTAPNMKPYEILVFFSGIERTLAGSKFNMRVDECRAAAYALSAYGGLQYGKFKEAYMRAVPRELFETYRYRLPDNWRKRAQHWFEEYERVEMGVAAWRRGDMDVFGKLSFESGNSSIVNWETGSDELKTLYMLLSQTDGVYGGRFSGAGFKGCCMALVDPAFEEKIVEKVTAGYLAQFPDLKDKYSVHICHSADGVKV